MGRMIKNSHDSQYNVGTPVDLERDSTSPEKTKDSNLSPEKTNTEFHTS